MDNNLNLAQQEKLKKAEINLSWMGSLLLSRSAVLSITASLAVALLVIFSLGEKLVPLSDKEFKILTTLLLLVIPISLFHYIIELNVAINKTVKSIEKILGSKILDTGNGWGRIKKEIIQTLVAHMPLFMVAIISIVIFYIIYAIWR